MSVLRRLSGFPHHAFVFLQNQSWSHQIKFDCEHLELRLKVSTERWTWKTYNIKMNIRHSKQQGIHRAVSKAHLWLEDMTENRLWRKNCSGRHRSVCFWRERAAAFITNSSVGLIAANKAHTNINIVKCCSVISHLLFRAPCVNIYHLPLAPRPLTQAGALCRLPAAGSQTTPVCLQCAHSWSPLTSWCLPVRHV